MGGAKRLMEEQDAKSAAAIDIALEAGVLKQCEFHEGSIYEGGQDIENAYKLGNHRMSRGELEGVFKSRREMTDAIKEVVDENAAEECYACAKNRDE